MSEETELDALQSLNDQTLAKADNLQRWVPWYKRRGRIWGYGREFRKAMRQVSWRRVK